MNLKINDAHVLFWWNAVFWLYYITWLIYDANFGIISHPSCKLQVFKFFLLPVFPDSDSEPNTKDCRKHTSECTDLSSDPSINLGGPVPGAPVQSLEDVFMNQASQHNTTNNGQLHGPVVNPIDKLYSMQSSYFSVE